MFSRSDESRRKIFLAQIKKRIEKHFTRHVVRKGNLSSCDKFSSQSYTHVRIWRFQAVMTSARMRGKMPAFHSTHQAFHRHPPRHIFSQLFTLVLPGRRKHFAKEKRQTKQTVSLILAPVTDRAMSRCENLANTARRKTKKKIPHVVLVQMTRKSDALTAYTIFSCHVRVLGKYYDRTT